MQYKIDMKKFFKSFCFIVFIVFLIGVSVGMIIGYTVKSSKEKEPVLESTKPTIIAWEETQTKEPTPTETPTPTPLPELEPQELEEEPELKSLGIFETTAYCACMKCCGKTDGITATGTKATEGRTIAVDPKVIPYGTKVIIDGKEYVAEDCGGGIKQNRIDVYFENHQDALKYGRQKWEVFIEGSEENV